MRTVKVRSREPDMIRKMVLAALIGTDLKGATNFSEMAKQSVDLKARNTPNLKSRDLAVLQVCDLALKYGVRVELI